MKQVNVPREWWIEEFEACESTSNERWEAYAEARESNNAEQNLIHVIEYSAVRGLKDELKEMTDLKNKAAEIAIAIGFEHNCKVKEIEDLKAELSALREATSAHDKSRANLILENDRLREDINKLRVAKDQWTKNDQITFGELIMERAKLRSVLAMHHQWHQDIGTVIIDGDELNLSLEYSDSTMCEKTMEVLK